jgi:ubiquinone/menaquinone biosynthesis C-methylase UbiE
MTIVNCDIHKLPFDDNSFDTIVDTFGLECAYDVEKAYNEMKRLCKY